MILSSTMGYISAPHERITEPTNLMQHFSKIHKHFGEERYRSADVTSLSSVHFMYLTRA